MLCYVQSCVYYTHLIELQGLYFSTFIFSEVYIQKEVLKKINFIQEGAFFSFHKLLHTNTLVMTACTQERALFFSSALEALTSIWLRGLWSSDIAKQAMCVCVLSCLVQFGPITQILLKGWEFIMVSKYLYVGCWLHLLLLYLSESTRWNWCLICKEYTEEPTLKLVLTCMSKSLAFITINYFLFFQCADIHVNYLIILFAIVFKYCFVRKIFENSLTKVYSPSFYWFITV